MEASLLLYLIISSSITTALTIVNFLVLVRIDGKSTK
jgi:hypothetical protein